MNINCFTRPDLILKVDLEKAVMTLNNNPELCHKIINIFERMSEGQKTFYSSLTNKLFQFFRDQPSLLKKIEDVFAKKKPISAEDQPLKHKKTPNLVIDLPLEGNLPALEVSNFKFFEQDSINLLIDFNQHNRSLFTSESSSSGTLPVENIAKNEKKRKIGEDVLYDESPNNEYHSESFESPKCKKRKNNSDIFELFMQTPLNALKHLKIEPIKLDKLYLLFIDELFDIDDSKMVSAMNCLSQLFHFFPPGEHFLENIKLSNDLLVHFRAYFSKESIIKIFQSKLIQFKTSSKPLENGNVIVKESVFRRLKELNIIKDNCNFYDLERYEILPSLYLVRDHHSWHMMKQTNINTDEYLNPNKQLNFIHLYESSDSSGIKSINFVAKDLKNTQYIFEYFTLSNRYTKCIEHASINIRY